MENDLEICKDILSKLYTLQSVDFWLDWFVDRVNELEESEKSGTSTK